MLKRRPRPSPAREPHPDPRVEVQLQQILSLRRSADRNERLLDGHHDNHARLAATVAKHPTWDGHRQRLAEIDRLNGEIARLNLETAELHAQAQELCAKVGGDDLMWLEPLHRN